MRGRPIAPRAVAPLALVVLALAAAGCSSTQPSASPAPTTRAALCAEALVIACADGPDSLLVELSASATDADAVEYAQRARGVGEAEGLEGGVTLQVEGPEAPQLDGEVASPPKLTLQVYPGDGDDVMQTLDRVIEVADVPGTTGISLDPDGWPTVEVLNLSEFEWVFTTVEELPLFEQGGTYTLVSTEPRLRIVHVPTRMSDDAIRDIIAIAIAYPDAEVLLEDATSPPHHPTLYVSGLTADEVVALDERLSDPELADADVDGYAVSYVLGTLGPDGMEYTGGTFGGVPTG